jgi:hypothetical protein
MKKILDKLTWKWILLFYIINGIICSSLIIITGDFKPYLILFTIISIFTVLSIVGDINSKLSKTLSINKYSKLSYEEITYNKAKIAFENSEGRIPNMNNAEDMRAISAIQLGIQHMFQNSNTEKILCAAIHNPEELDIAGNPLIYCGLRHPNILWQSKSISRNPRHQGFLTTTGRFVNREEALEIALKNNQVLDLSNIRGNNLYSEDLY